MNKNNIKKNTTKTRKNKNLKQIILNKRKRIVEFKLK